MKLRKLELRDAPLMLEWMHDINVIKYMKMDFSSKTIADCKEFIKQSWIDTKNFHFAIDVDGIYMGTVSLKNVDDNKAEFAITIRSAAMGQGISKEAMALVINYGLFSLNLHEIYWYVDISNKRAIRFYDKNGYFKCANKEFGVADSKYIWYCIKNKEFDNEHF